MTKPFLFRSIRKSNRKKEEIEEQTKQKKIKKETKVLHKIVFFRFAADNY